MAAVISSFWEWIFNIFTSDGFITILSLSGFLMIVGGVGSAFQTGLDWGEVFMILAGIAIVIGFGMLLI